MTTPRLLVLSDRIRVIGPAVSWPLCQMCPEPRQAVCAKVDEHGSITMMLCDLRGTGQWRDDPELLPIVHEAPSHRGPEQITIAAFEADILYCLENAERGADDGSNPFSSPAARRRYAANALAQHLCWDDGPVTRRDHFPADPPISASCQAPCPQCPNVCGDWHHDDQLARRGHHCCRHGHTWPLYAKQPLTLDFRDDLSGKVISYCPCETWQVDYDPMVPLALVDEAIAEHLHDDHRIPDPRQFAGWAAVRGSDMTKLLTISWPART